MKTGDIIVLLLACGLLVQLFHSHWSSVNAAQLVSVHTPFETFQLSLQQAQQLRVKGTLGDSQLQIADGRIRFLSTPCRLKYCVHSGWLQHAGEFAACLPNGVSIAVQGQDAMYDAINF